MASVCIAWAGVRAVCVRGEKVSWQGSFSADLRDLCVSCLVGRLDEHWLGQLLSCWHCHLLYLIQLLRKRRKDGEV